MNQAEKANENEKSENKIKWKIQQLLNVVAFSATRDLNL